MHARQPESISETKDVIEMPLLSHISFDIAQAAFQ